MPLLVEPLKLLLRAKALLYGVQVASSGQGEASSSPNHNTCVAVVSSSHTTTSTVQETGLVTRAQTSSSHQTSSGNGGNGGSGGNGQVTRSSPWVWGLGLPVLLDLPFWFNFVDGSLF